MLLSSQFFVVLSTTALAIMLARSLGPSDWGLFSALLALSMALSIFVSLGLGTWLLRELSQARADDLRVSRQRESSQSIVGAVILNGVFGCALLAVAAAGLVVVGADVATAIALLGLIGHTIFAGAAACLESLLRAERRLKTVVAATLLERISLLALATIAVAAGQGIWAIGLAYLFGSLARLLFAGRQVFWKLELPVCLPAFAHLRRFVVSGLPFAFNTMAMNVIPRLDTVIIATISVTSAGYFALADRILGPAQIIPVVASSALYPFLAREVPGSRAARRISSGMMIVGCVLAVVGALAAPWLVPAVFGSSYRPAIGVVQVMLFALPFVYASNPLLAYLYTVGRERHVLFVTLGASVLGTVAILFGQLLVGVTGAAFGYLARQLLFTIALGMIAVLVVPPRGDPASVPSPLGVSADRGDET